MAIWEGARRKFGDETDEVTWEARDPVWVRDRDQDRDQDQDQDHLPRARAAWARARLPRVRDPLLRQRAAPV